MLVAHFIDTCVVFYGFVQNDPKQARALSVLRSGGMISVQVLNELANSLRNKLKIEWAEISVSMQMLKVLTSAIKPLTVSTHDIAIRIADRYRFNIYDCLILASAIEAGCTELYTEDLQHGQTVEGVRIINPFLQPER